MDDDKPDNQKYWIWVQNFNDAVSKYLPSPSPCTITTTYTPCCPNMKNLVKVEFLDWTPPGPPRVGLLDLSLVSLFLLRNDSGYKNSLAVKLGNEFYHLTEGSTQKVLEILKERFDAEFG